MDRFFQLLKEGQFLVKYDEEYNNEWTDIEISNHIIQLYCSFNKLTTLPELLNVQTLYCSFNKLTTLPELPFVKELYCSNNQLIELNRMPNVQILSCEFNQLTNLNQVPQVKTLYCWNNNLFSSRLDDWKIIWKLKRTLIHLYLVPKLFSRWKLTTIRNRLSIEHKEAIICHPKTYYVIELYNENNIE